MIYRFPGHTKSRNAGANPVNGVGGYPDYMIGAYPIVVLQLLESY